jgi:hypothetical protein
MYCNQEIMIWPRLVQIVCYSGNRPRQRELIQRLVAEIIVRVYQCLLSLGRPSMLSFCFSFFLSLPLASEGAGSVGLPEPLRAFKLSSATADAA